MADRPILFSAPMVRALLDGRKTQTRRTLSRLAKRGQVTEFGLSDTAGYDWHFRDGGRRWHDVKHDRLKQLLPYHAGDRLWVRETWADVNTSVGPGIGYHADGNFYQPEYDGPDFGAGPSYDYDKYPGNYTMWFSDLQAGEPDHSWRPSIFMPRWASRLTLHVEDVKVERLQDISEEDARAEGVDPRASKLSSYRSEWDGSGALISSVETRTLRPAFRNLWNSINGRDAWDANPWVVAVTFRVEHANIDAGRSALEEG